MKRTQFKLIAWLAAALLVASAVFRAALQASYGAAPGYGAAGASGKVGSSVTLWVDPRFGSDTLAQIGYLNWPFATIDGANAAAAALTQLSAPTFPTTIFTAASTTGGVLAQSTSYLFEITALNANGETTPSAEKTYTTPASGTSTNQITINWNVVSGATAYNVYYITNAGGSGNEQFYGQVPAGTTSVAITGFRNNEVAPKANTTANALIQLTTGYFYQGASTGFDLQLTPGVSLNGMGWSTVIVGAGSTLLNPGSNCSISNLQLFDPAQRSGLSTRLAGGTDIGDSGSDQAGTNVNFQNVWFNGAADCIFLTKTTTGSHYPAMTWNFFGCYFTSWFDTTNVTDTQTTQAWPLVLNFFNCDFFSQGDSGGNIARCLCISSGSGVTFNVYGGSAICSGAAGGTAVVSVAGTNNAINLYGVAIATTSTGGTQNSIKVGSGCTVHAGSGCDFDPSLISNTGTITTQAQILFNHASGIAAGAGAGTSPSVSLASTSDDHHGTITVTTGSTPSASSVVATITFAKTQDYSAVTLTPANAAAAALSGTASVYVSSSGTANFVISVGSSALTGATSYLWNYTN